MASVARNGYPGAGPGAGETDGVMRTTSIRTRHWPIWLVSLVLIVAAVIDGVRLRVPNWVTFPLVAAGWLYSGVAFGWEGLGWSLLGTAYRLGIPVTVHVAIGTDIIHMHPMADGAAIGEASLRDFHRLASQIAHLEGGAYLNVGSAVVLPEVFMKALNLARNQGNKVEAFTTVDMDFIKHYRPSVNVVDRPVRMGGRGYQLIGHHELNLPLLAVAVLERLAARPEESEQA